MFQNCKDILETFTDCSSACTSCFLSDLPLSKIVTNGGN